MATSSEMAVGKKFGLAEEPGTARSYQILTALCGIFVLHSLYLACIAEDAHITYRFARHVAEGYGFTWNINEAPIEGFTSFIWVLISAIGIKSNLNIFWLTQCLGIISALGSIGLTFVIARRFMGASAWTALVPCLFLAVSGPLATWASSGMEMSTFGFFILLAVYGYLVQLRSSSLKWLIVSSLSLCVATLLRPEGAMVFVVLAGLASIAFWKRTWATIGQHLLWIAVYSLPLVIFMVWRLQVFGDPLPNTFYQKTGGGFWQHARGAGYVIYFAFFYLTPLLLFPALLGWEAGAPKARGLFRIQSWLRWANEQEAMAISGALVLAYFSYMIYAGGDYMAMYRFMVPVLPFLYLLLVPIVEPLRRLTFGTPHKMKLLVLAVVIAAGATVIHSTPIEQSFFRKATWQHGNYRGVQSERRYVARFELIGRFFDDYSSRAGQALATRSIGAIGYYARDLAIHDLSGLTDRHIGSVPVVATPRGWAGHEKWDLDYSFGRLPTFFMLDEHFAEEKIPDSLRKSAADLSDAIEYYYPAASRYAAWIRANPDFIEKHYKLVTVWMVDEANGQMGYFAFLERTP